MKNSVKIAIIAAQFVLASLCQAASVSLSPSSQNAMVGDSLSFDLNVNFSDIPTISGGFNITYDSSILGLTSFNYATIDPDILIPWTPISTGTAGLISGIGFEVDASAFGGGITLATLNFSVLNQGVYNVGLVESVQFLEADGLSFIDVTYNGATGQITAIPVPAALWLLASGLSALGLGLRRRS